MQIAHLYPKLWFKTMLNALSVSIVGVFKLEHILVFCCLFKKSQI